MDTLREYSDDIRFIFMRVNAHIVNVRIYSTYNEVYLPKDVMMKIFNELGINTEVDYVCISHETAETLVGLLTTLRISFIQSTGN